MVFGSLEVWLLLPVAILIFYILPKKFRWSILLLGSIMYLGYYSVPFLIYAVIYAVLNYYFARILYPISNARVRKRLYIVFLVINIGQLVVFKYIDFLADNVNWLLSSFSDTEVPYLNLLVPIGISYYTFQAIGYIVNVYRKNEQAEKHIGLFVIYNLFFPKIISGPIERSDRFLVQLHEPAEFSPKLFKSGMRLILFGMVKKLIVAERLGIMVNNVYGNLDEYTGTALLIIFFIQMMYLYTDFSGYTDIALGIAALFGIHLTNNFNRPFFAKNVSDFWRRWHISLSSWCNDYIFKTIIFKRRRWGKWASVYGVFIAFLVIGIWHGPNWTFVMIGLLQGIAINYEFFTKRKRLQIGSKLPKFLNDTLSIIITYLFASFSQIFFFSENLKASMYFIGHMFDFGDLRLIGNNLGLEHRNVLIALIGVVIILIIEYIEESGYRFVERIERFPLVFRWSIYYGIMILVILYGQFATTNFIYFQF